MGDPCHGHKCDECFHCRRGQCCRGDNPTYSLPEEGSHQPFFGSLGVLREDDDQQECHVCGEWFVCLAKHVWHSHDLTATEYRAVFGLAWSQPLKSKSFRDKVRAKTVASGHLIPYQSGGAVSMTQERRAMLSSRPKRRQVRDKWGDTHREAQRAAAAASLANRKPANLVELPCAECGAMLRLWPSQVGRGYRRCAECGEEAKRRRMTGLPPKNAKLSPERVATIRERYRAGGISQKALAGEFGVTQATVSLISRGLIWNGQQHATQRAADDHQVTSK